MISIHTLMTVKYILYWSGCIVYMFLGTGNQLNGLFLETSVAGTTCVRMHWGISVFPLWHLWWSHGQEFSVFGAGSSRWMLLGVNLIMTTLDEGGIQCLDQIFNIAMWSVLHTHKAKWLTLIQQIADANLHVQPHMNVTLRSYLLPRVFGLKTSSAASPVEAWREDIFSPVSLLMGPAEGLRKETEDYIPAVFLRRWQVEGGGGAASSMAVSGKALTTRTSKAKVQWGNFESTFCSDQMFGQVLRCCVCSSIEFTH